LKKKDVGQKGLIRGEGVTDGWVTLTPPPVRRTNNWEGIARAERRDLEEWELRKERISQVKKRKKKKGRI